MNFKSLKEAFQGTISRAEEIFAGKKVHTQEENSLTTSLLKQFDYIETVPVRFGEGVDDLFFYWIEQAEPLLNSVSDPDGLLEQRVVALKYRLEKENGGEDPTAFSEEALHLLQDFAYEWKKNHPLINIAALSPREVLHLKSAAKYPLFFSLIQRSKVIREEFMNWVLRDENDVVPFIQFPASVSRLMKCGLSGRISLFGGTFLKIQRRHTGVIGVTEKVLTLPFEGNDFSILDPSLKVTLKGNYRLSIADVFKDFSRKEIDVGRLEFMAEGIVNWNIHQLAYWNANSGSFQQINLEDRAWWNQMPLLEVLNRRQVWQRYKIDIKPHQWIASACATRGRPNLDYEETHAYLEVAIPRGKGYYAIYDFGKLTLHYPETVFERLKMFTETVHATVAYPDENIYYTHRQKGFQPFALTHKQGYALMTVLKNDMVRSRERNFIYQIESENCAKWVHQKLEEVLGKGRVPDLFRMQLLDTEPHGPVAHLFHWIKQLPARWQVPVLAHLHLPLGAFRKIWIWEEGRKVAKSLSSHTFFETGQIYLPALLVAKVLAMASSIQEDMRFAFKQGLDLWLRWTPQRTMEHYAKLLFEWRVRRFDSALCSLQAYLSQLKPDSCVFGARLAA